jgi:hypothetical protein
MARRAFRPAAGTAVAFMPLIVVPVTDKPGNTGLTAGTSVELPADAASTGGAAQNKTALTHTSKSNHLVTTIFAHVNLIRFSSCRPVSIILSLNHRLSRNFYRHQPIRL